MRGGGGGGRASRGLRGRVSCLGATTGAMKMDRAERGLRSLPLPPEVKS